MGHRHDRSVTNAITAPRIAGFGEVLAGLRIGAGHELPPAGGIAATKYAIDR